MDEYNRQDNDQGDSHEPLIARENGSTTQERGNRQWNDNGRTVGARSGTGRSLWMLTLSAGISGLLFGYDTGIISSTLIALDTSLGRPTTVADQSLITSSTSFFALLTSPVSGILADSIGRKPIIALASLLFVLGAAVQSLAPSVSIMVLGRSIVGAAIGSASGIVPLYIGEISPADQRGALVTVQALFITAGQVLAYIIGYAAQGQWRLGVGLGAVPALLQAVLLLGTPESPRWLVMRARESEARTVLLRLGSGDVDAADAVLARIREDVKAESLVRADQGSVWRSLLVVPRHRRALTIACFLQALQQLCGFNVLMYFSATIFAANGFSSPLLTSLSVAVTNFVFTLANYVLVDNVRRRRILLLSIPFMVLGLGLCSAAFAGLASSDAKARIDPSALGVLVSGTPPSTPRDTGLMPYALLTSLILYVAAYALGIGCVPWQQGELFALSVRGLGSGLATATNFGSNFVVAATFLPAMHTVGSSGTFGLYALVCVLGWVGVWFIYPETKGLELEEVGALLDDGWGVGSGRKSLDVERRTLMSGSQRL